MGELLLIACDPEEPAPLISMLLLQMHACQLYSLALTWFLLHSGGLPKNVWNANNAMLSWVSSIFGAWIHHVELGQCSSAVHSKWLFPVHCLCRVWTPFTKKSVNCIVTSLTQNTELSQWNHFNSGPKIFHLPQEPNMYNTLIKNHPQCATHYNFVQLCHICINQEALSPHFLTLGYY